MPVKPSCAVILIHGMGYHKPDWSNNFSQALEAELGPSFRRVRLANAYWADLAAGKGTAKSLEAPEKGEAAALEDEIYDRTVQQISPVVDAEVNLHTASLSFGPGDIKSGIPNIYQIADDLRKYIASYVAGNEFRTAVQNVLHSKLTETEFLKMPAMLVAHSQGTVISYDVLRQAGGNYTHLRTWITMGSPLRKYYISLLKWGKERLGVPPALRWVNLYDAKDIVGNDLKDAVGWVSPVPEDHEVNNRQNATGAHDHWGNPQVVKLVADEIRKLLA